MPRTVSRSRAFPARVVTRAINIQPPPPPAGGGEAGDSVVATVERKITEVRLARRCAGGELGGRWGPTSVDVAGMALDSAPAWAPLAVEPVGLFPRLTSSCVLHSHPNVRGGLFRGGGAAPHLVTSRGSAVRRRSTRRPWSSRRRMATRTAPTSRTFAGPPRAIVLRSSPSSCPAHDWWVPPWGTCPTSSCCVHVSRPNLVTGAAVALAPPPPSVGRRPVPPPSQHQCGVGSV